MKKIGVIFLVLSTVPLALAYYYWQQATRLPEWYTASEATDQQLNSAGIKTAEERLEPKVKANIEVDRINNKSKISNEQELNDLLTSKVSKSIAANGLGQAVKGSNTAVKNGKVESGVVVSVSEIPVDKLEGGQKAVFEKAIKVFPPLKRREVYLGIEGKPRTENGQLVFGDNTKIKVGNLSFTALELSKKLGVPKDSVEKAMRLKLES